MKRAEQVKKLYGKLGDKYLAKIAGKSSDQLPIFCRLIKKEGKVLEVGCAGGRDSQYFVKKGFSLTGIDLVDKFLQKSRELVPKGKFKKMDILALDFPENYFDAIWCHAVLVDINRQDLRKVLANFLRVLKSQGVVHLEFKRGRGSKVVSEDLISGEKRKISYFQIKEVTEKAKAVGFTVIKSEQAGDSLGRRFTKWARVWAVKPKN